MLRNLFLTLATIAKSTAKALTAQQKYLGSLAKVVLDSKIALDYFLAEQGVCAIANTSCCT